MIDDVPPTAVCSSIREPVDGDADVPAPSKMRSCPLTSSAKLEEMSLFTAIELLPVPSRVFPLRETSEAKVTDRPTTFTVVSDPPSPMVFVPVEPVPMLMGPVRSGPVPMLSISSELVLLAILISDPAVLEPVAMFNRELLVAFPENAFVVAPLGSPVPRLKTPPFLAPVIIFAVSGPYELLNVKFPVDAKLKVPPLKSSCPLLLEVPQFKAVLWPD